jgi:predicted lipoprotein with Yx(FWY)xxD motif
MRTYKDHNLRRLSGALGLPGALRLLGTLALALLTLVSLSASGAVAATGTGTNPKSAFEQIGAAKATGKTLSLAKSKQGIFAIGPNGHSLYVYAGDHGTKSGCTGGCATAWPAFTESGSITTGVLIKKSEVGKADGQKADQLTYYGHLLYYFKGDTAPGDTNGVGIKGWHLIGPFGNVMLPRG